jgi:methyl-accepting chemotaxis protein
MNFSDMKIGTRLAGGFGLVLALLAVLFTLGLSNMASIHETLRATIHVNNVQMDAVRDMRDAQRRVVIAAGNIALLTDLNMIPEQVTAVARARADYARASGVLHKMVGPRNGADILARIDRARNATEPMADKVIDFGLARDPDNALVTMMTEVTPAAEQWQKLLGQLLDLQAASNSNNARDAEANYGAATLAMIVTGVAAIALGALIAVLATRSITRPLAHAVAVAQAVAAGDLTSRFGAESEDETGQLLRALRIMNRSLLTIVGEVRDSTDTIASASIQISNSNLNLSARTEQQASSLGETAASMARLIDTVKRNADNARQANQLAVSASDVAIRGGDVVAQVVETMGLIDTSAKKIVDIISVIDAIAFQTNILALNAAVEAARAGEQGRGFAVVAAEVRNLAQRSAGAAKEIKQLINDSMERVGSGTRLVGQAGTAMNNVVASIQRVSDIVGEISMASQEQTTGIEQINEAISQLDAVVQQNVVLVGDATNAAASLEQLASTLVEVVGIFKVGASASGKPIEDVSLHLASDLGDDDETDVSPERARARLAVAA